MAIDTGQPGPMQMRMSLGGGSAGRPGPAGQGGGYQDVCIESGADLRRAGAAPDPRLDELRLIGLPQPWPRVARLLGYDTFMLVWQALATVEDAGTRDRVVLPKLATYLRFQRNQLVRSLAADGLSAEEIRAHLLEVHSDAPTESHIRRLISAK